jgi:hypothetical protein
MKNDCLNRGSSWCADFYCTECPARNLDKPPESPKVVCPKPLDCDFFTCSHRKPHPRNDKCIIGCKYGGFPDCIPVSQPPASEGLLLTENEILQLAIDSLPASGGKVQEFDIQWVRTVCQAQHLKDQQTYEVKITEHENRVAEIQNAYLKHSPTESLFNAIMKVIENEGKVNET